MKTVQEAMATCNKNRVIAEYIKLCNQMLNKRTICRLYQLMDELQERKVEPSKDDIVISEFSYKNHRVRFESYVAKCKDIVECFRLLDYFDEFEKKETKELELLLGPSAVLSLTNKYNKVLELHKNYETDSYPGWVESYSYEFEPWNTILGYRVPDHILDSPNKCTYIAAVLYEMTFWGFYEEEVQATADEYANRADQTDYDLKTLSKKDFEKKYSNSWNNFIKDLDITFEKIKDEEAEEDKSTRSKNYIIKKILDYREMKKTYADLSQNTGET